MVGWDLKFSNGATNNTMRLYTYGLAIVQKFLVKSRDVVNFTCHGVNYFHISNHIDFWASKVCNSKGNTFTREVYFEDDSQDDSLAIELKDDATARTL